MRKILIVLACVTLLLSTACNKSQSEKAAVERAQVNIEQSEILQVEIDGLFAEINNCCDFDMGPASMKKAAVKIQLNSTNAQGNLRKAITNMKLAKENSEDYQMKNFYDLKVNALRTKKTIVNNSFHIATEIENDSSTYKVKTILRTYHQREKELEERYKRLDNEAKSYLDLQTA